jgi:hypothetical protein
MSDLDHFCERFVSENQVIRSRRRGAVFKGADLPIGSAKTYLVYAEQHVGRALQLGLR